MLPAQATPPLPGGDRHPSCHGSKTSAATHADPRASARAEARKPACRSQETPAVPYLQIRHAARWSAEPRRHRSTRVPRHPLHEAKPRKKGRHAQAGPPEIAHEHRHAGARDRQETGRLTTRREHRRGAPVPSKKSTARHRPSCQQAVLHQANQRRALRGLRHHDDAARAWLALAEPTKPLWPRLHERRNQPAAIGRVAVPTMASRSNKPP